MGKGKQLNMWISSFPKDTNDIFGMSHAVFLCYPCG